MNLSGALTKKKFTKFLLNSIRWHRTYKITSWISCCQQPQVWTPLCLFIHGGLCWWETCRCLHLHQRSCRCCNVVFRSAKLVQENHLQHFEQLRLHMDLPIGCYNHPCRPYHVPKKSAWVIAHLWCDLRLRCLALRWRKDLKLRWPPSEIHVPDLILWKKVENTRMTSLHASLALKECVFEGRSELKCLSVAEYLITAVTKKMSMKFWELVLSSGHHQGSKQKQTNKFCKHV